jgi:nitrilase
MLLRAGSGVAGPDGAWIAGPHCDTADTLFADLDLAMIREQLMTLDTDGHYSRPDVFTLTVDETPTNNVEFSAAQDED